VTPLTGTTPSATVETQPERTALAWQRTGLGVLAVAGLLAHRAAEEERRVLLVLAGAAGLLGLLLGVLAPVRYRDVRRRVAAGTGVSAPRLVVVATATVLVVAAVAAVAVLTPR
jgi:putative membrane protein